MKPLFVETLVMLRVLATTSLSVTALAAVPKLLKRPGVMLLLRSSGPCEGRAKGETTFRKTRAGAVSYFVGDNATIDDLGFAIGTPGVKRIPWMICRPEIIVFQILGNIANAMGWVHIEAADRTRSKVDKTWICVRR